MTELSWGRRYLMCPPEHFQVLYEINPWMHREVSVDLEAARAQWEALVSLLEKAGASVELVRPVEDLPDMVFTANAGVVDGARFVASRFLHPEREAESGHFARWFSKRGFGVDEFPPGVHLEGAGDALAFGDRLVAGYRIRSDFAAHSWLSSLLSAEVLSIELIDPRFYHIDLTFCPLSQRAAMIYPQAWDRYGREALARVVPEPVVLETGEAESFCANSVVVGNLVIMPACTARLGKELEALGFDIAVTPVDEFLKAGGGVRCLTLALDVDLRRK
ncbi:MAG: dimethylarginine dimethylaminohydrolase family protein [Actinomycetota bacterium]